MLEKTRSPRNNINIQEMAAIKSLKRDKDIRIIQADKGNCTVVLNEVDYQSKLNTLLQSGVYEPIEKDPTLKIERRIRCLLSKHKTSLPTRVKQSLSPYYTKPPHLYGLPKIHKPDIPLRPIISSIGSPCYALAGYLLKILRPFSGKSTSFIKNSYHFVQLLNSITPQATDILVSFDVINMFTNIPVDEALVVIGDELQKDYTLASRSCLQWDAIMELLEVCLKTTYFQVDNKFFQQKDGMAMGNSLSPIVCDLYMVHFEKLALDSALFKPSCWFRYVDDTFVIWPHGPNTLQNFLIHLNSIRPTIQFTMETEVNNTIPFLDVLVTKTDATFSTKVYRKPTHTGRYLNFESNHPPHIKKGLIRGLQKRAITICQDQNDQHKEISHLRREFLTNGYPPSFIDSAFKTKSCSRPEQNYMGTMYIAYVKGVSEKIKRIAERFKIKTIFQTKHTLKSMFVKTTPKGEPQHTSHCIYSIPCECGRYYIGETGRPLAVRLREHKHTFKEGLLDKSRLAQHAYEEDHSVKWDGTGILDLERNATVRKYKEAAYMAWAGNTISQPSLDFSIIWSPLVFEEMNGIHNSKKRGD